MFERVRCFAENETRGVRCRSGRVTVDDADYELGHIARTSWTTRPALI